MNILKTTILSFKTIEEIHELRNKLQEIISNNLYRENNSKVRNEIYYQILELLSQYGLEDLHFGVMPMELAIEYYRNHFPIDYEEIENQIYIGPTPCSPLKDILAWRYLIGDQNNDKDERMSKKL